MRVVQVIKDYPEYYYTILDKAMERLERVLHMNQMHGQLSQSSADSEAHQALTAAHRAARAKMVSFRDKIAVDDASNDDLAQLPGLSQAVPKAPAGRASACRAMERSEEPSRPMAHGREAEPCGVGSGNAAQCFSASASQPPRPLSPTVAATPLDVAMSTPSSHARPPANRTLTRSKTLSTLPIKAREHRSGSLRCDPMGPGIVGKNSILNPERLQSPAAGRSLDTRTRRRRSSEFAIKPMVAPVDTDVSMLWQLEHGMDDAVRKQHPEPVAAEHSVPAAAPIAPPNIMQAFMRTVVGGAAAATVRRDAARAIQAASPNGSSNGSPGGRDMDTCEA